MGYYANPSYNPPYNPYNPQDMKMIPMPKHVTLERELEKQKEYYQRTIKEESPAQKKREERRKEIVDEYKKSNNSMQDIVKQLNSKNMEILKLTNGEEITVEDERKGLYEDRDRLYEDIKELKLKMISLMKELGSLKEEAAEEAAAEEYPRGGKRKSKNKSKKVSKKPVVSQKKQSIYKEILGKQMKIYKMPDSRKEYVKYKGELLHISDYKDLMKQKAIAKTKTKVTKVTQKKAKSKTKK